MKFKVDNLSSSMLLSKPLTAYEKYGVLDGDGCQRSVDINFNSLEELKSFAEEFEEQLIVNFEDMTITIYDGYNE